VTVARKCKIEAVQAAANAEAAGEDFQGWLRGKRL
jgi:hypothetical protein